MNLKLTGMALIGAALVACNLQASAPVSQYSVDNQFVPNSWLVELDGEPAVSGLRLQSVQLEQARAQTAMRATGVRFDVRERYSRVFNGFAVYVSDADASRLGRAAGVKAIYPVVRFELPKETVTTGDNPDLATSTGMIGAPFAQNTLGFKGNGIKVGIIDSGIDLQHPDFGTRVQGGMDFVGNAYDASSADPAINTPVPDNDPDDCGGHGTHVAGIVGANGVVKGVAPGVTLTPYKVFGCSGSVSADVLLEAMERALNDGMDVINMSLGSPFQWPNYPSAQAVDRLAQAGLIVVASAGNSGTAGLYANGGPGISEAAIGVASVDNTTSQQAAFTVSGSSARFGFVRGGGVPISPNTGTFPLARTGTVTTANDACAPLTAGSLLLQQGLQRANGGCNRGRAVQQPTWCALTSPDGHAPDHDFRANDLSGGWRNDQYPDGRGSRHLDLDGVDRQRTHHHGRASLELQLLRSIARPQHETRSCRTRRSGLLHVSLGARRLREPLWNLNGFAACGGRGRADPAKVPGAERQRPSSARTAPEHRLEPAVRREPSPGCGSRPASRRGHDRHSASPHRRSHRGTLEVVAW
jgi:hypothetical protein